MTKYEYLMERSADFYKECIYFIKSGNDDLSYFFLKASKDAKRKALEMSVEQGGKVI